MGSCVSAMISCSQLSTCLLCAASIVCIAGLSELDTATTTAGRRGGQIQTSGRFFVGSTSNRAGNDELEFEQNEEDLGLSLDVLKVAQSSESRAVQIQRLELALAALKREDTGLSAGDERIEEGDASKATESSDDTITVDNDLDEVSKRAPTSVQELGASVEKGSFEKGMSRILEKGRENNKQHQKGSERQKEERKQKEERTRRGAPTPKEERTTSNTKKEAREKRKFEQQYEKHYLKAYLIQAAAHCSANSDYRSKLQILRQHLHLHLRRHPRQHPSSNNCHPRRLPRA